jgi:eukaryotic-like serine/threonine-protein kinase
VLAGKYRIESIVGTGGMGVVMGAADVSLGRAVAIKFLSPQKLARPGARERFEREARAAAQIQSEHVVRVYEIGNMPPQGTPFIVMEHLRGADLSQVLQSRGGLPIDEAVDFVLQSCEALGEAHARGIVHRDLKPQNLFLTQRPDGSPCVKVLDFGISKAQEDDQQNLTSTDMVMGTPLYMSPEQVRSLKNVDHRSDIWALGSILFELLTASPVFEAPSMSALCAMIATDPPLPLRARRPQAPPELEQVILRCLHKDPNGRFQDVAALADALTPFASPRGRDSAMRVSRVVRGAAPHVALAGSVPPMGAAQMVTSGTTMSAAGGQMAPTYLSHPPGGGPMQHPPTTQQTWQQSPTGSMIPPQPMAAPPRQSGGGSGLVIALGVVAGLVLVGAVGGGIFYWRSHQVDAPTVANTSPSATGALTAPVNASTSTTTSTSTSTGGGAKTAPTSPTSPKPADAKDAGAAPAAADAGAPKPAADAGGGGGGTNPNEEAERNKVLAAQAQQRCDNYTRDMTTFARTPDDRKKAAERAKTFTCLKGPQASSCERQVCLNACTYLNDAMCLQQINYTINHGPKPAY